MSSMGDPSNPRSWKNTLFVVVVMLVVVVGALVAVSLVGFDEDPEDPWADEWSPKVRPFVRYVEKERDLEFLHPVHVEFLSEEEFTDDVTAEEEDLDEEDREQLEQAVSFLRALGMIEGELDLFKASNDLRGSATLAYYNHEDKRIRIRGKKLTPAVEVTLVHELTHALQDQRFDLEGRYHDYEVDEDEAGETAYDALVEGDAERIASAYEDSLSAREKEQLADERKREGNTFDERAKDVPEVMRTMIGAPYALGEAMLALAIEKGGNDEVDDLFRAPPTTEEHLFDPWTLIEDGDGGASVDEIELPDGAEEFDSGEFGAIGWYIMLAERMPVLRALDAVDGWAGDEYVAYESDERTCVRARYRAETAGDLTEMRSALRTWVSALPGAPASVTAEEGETLLFESCDPGTKAKVGRSASREALTLAVNRTYFGVLMLRSSVPVDASRCAANRAVHELSAAQMNSATYLNSPAAGARLRAMVQRCL